MCSNQRSACNGSWTPTSRYTYQNGLAELLCWLVLIGAEVLPRLEYP